jgi:hypothetical protein
MSLDDRSSSARSFVIARLFSRSWRSLSQNSAGDDAIASREQGDAVALSSDRAAVPAWKNAMAARALIS